MTVSIRSALVFPGQGSQVSGMLSGVPENDTFDRLLDAAEGLTDLPLREIESSGSPSDLADTRVAQPLLYLVDWAWAVALIESGMEPDAVAGHSLGELAALAIAGVYSVEAGLELVVERSRLMATAASATPGAMSAVIGLERDAIDNVVIDVPDVWLANDNALGQCIISGTQTAVDDATVRLTGAGARRVIPLPVSGAFHSPLMDSARKAFETLLDGAEFADAAIPVLQNTDPTPTRDADSIRARLAGQISAPVRWRETMDALAGTPPTLVVEAGPGSVLTGLAKRVEGITALSAEASGIEAVLQEVD